MTNTTKITAGFLVGTLLGATLGLLLAPQRGSKTRELLVEKAKDAIDVTNNTFNRAKNMLGLDKRMQEQEAV